MRVLITDFLAESDFEREVLPGVEVDALLSLIGHPPTPDDLVRFIGERPASVLITWYEMFFDSTTLAALSRAGVMGIVRAGVGFDNIDLMGAPELRASRSAMCPTTAPTKWQIMPWRYSYGAYVAYALPRPP